jgi:deoxyribose-phosphate aldolase
MKNSKNRSMNFPPLSINKDELSAEVMRFEKLSKSNKTPEMLKHAFSCIDLTTLNSTDTVTSVAAFTARVNTFEQEFPGMTNVAAICVYPNMTSVVRENLAVESVKVAAVAGGFPSSMTFKSIKAEEARLAVLQGADEIDVVLPLWAFLEGNLDYCLEEIKTIKNAIGETHLKIIIESGVLADPEKIWQASLLSLRAGADFIKTSTGKMPVSATPEAAVIMCQALKYWYENTGEKKGFKPAGGISQPEDALLYLTIAQSILGVEWVNNQHFRIGASRLANHLISDILDRPINHF